MSSNVTHRVTREQFVVKEVPGVEVLNLGMVKSAHMPKDTRLSFRVQSDLKKALEAIASKEARSVAQICEAILQEGVSTYQKDGSKYLQRGMSHQGKRLAKPS